VDVTELIENDHEEQRHLFALLDELGDDLALLAAVWDRLATFLEAHMTAEELLLHSHLPPAVAKAKNTIKGHAGMRAEISRARGLETGSRPWWQAVAGARTANDHSVEEERKDLAVLRGHASVQQRHHLAVKYSEVESTQMGPALTFLL
jgi:hypothetical protein